MSADKEYLDEVNKIRENLKESPTGRIIIGNPDDLDGFKKAWLEAGKEVGKVQVVDHLSEGLKAMDFVSAEDAIRRAAIIGSGAMVYDDHWKNQIAELKAKADAMGMPDLAFAQLMDICSRTNADPEKMLDSLANIEMGTKPRDLPIDVAELLGNAVAEEKVYEGIKPTRADYRKKPKDHQKQMRKRKRDQRKSRKNRRR